MPIKLSDITERPLVAALLAVGAAVVLLALLLVWRRSRQHARSADPSAPKSSMGLENVLTLVAAAIATGVSATGMWAVFTDILGEDNPARYFIFAFVEIAMFVSALRARRAYLLSEGASTGVDGIAVWVLSCLSAGLSALEAHSVPEVALRLAAPLVAAWLWERGLASELRAMKPAAARKINWRVSPERILVWLRLAEPTDRGVGEVDKARRVTALVRAAWTFHTLQGAKAKPWRLARAARKLRACAIAANEHIGLGSDEDVRELVRTQLATVYQVETATAPKALASLAPWSGNPARPIDDGERAALEAALATLRETHAAELAAVRAEHERTIAALQTQANGRAEQARPRETRAAEPREIKADRSWRGLSVPGEPEPARALAATTARSATVERVPGADSSTSREQRARRVENLAKRLLRGEPLTGTIVQDTYHVAPSTAQRLLRDARELAQEIAEASRADAFESEFELDQELADQPDWAVKTP